MFCGKSGHEKQSEVGWVKQETVPFCDGECPPPITVGSHSMRVDAWDTESSRHPSHERDVRTEDGTMHRSVDAVTVASFIGASFRYLGGTENRCSEMHIMNYSSHRRSQQSSVPIQKNQKPEMYYREIR